MRQTLIISVAALATLLAVVSPASANTKHIKLTGVVVGQNHSRPGGATIISFRQGTKIVGKFTISPGPCAFDECFEGGRGKLSVGELKGKLKLDVKFQSTGPINHNKPATYGAGMLTKGKNGRHGPVEAVRVNSSTMIKKVGAHFTMVVTA